MDHVHPPTMSGDKEHKAIKVARLAKSEELLGNEDAARTAGATAGRLTAEAGMTLPQLDELTRLSGSPVAWDACVDGWYDAQPADVTADEMNALVSFIGTRSLSLYQVAERMVAEIQRRRHA